MNCAEVTVPQILHFLSKDRKTYPHSLYGTLINVTEFISALKLYLRQAI